MKPDRFTIKSQEALEAAQRLADERHNPQTTPEHLLAVLLEQGAASGGAEGASPAVGLVVAILRKLGVEPEMVRQEVNQALEGLPRLSGGQAGEPAGGSSELV